MLRTAADLMQTKVISIRPGATLRELAQLLDDEGIHGAPVVDSAGNPVGVVSRSDLVAAMNEDEPAERPTAHYYAVSEDEVLWDDDDDGGTRLADSIEGERQVAEIMSPRILTAGRLATAGELARKMAKHGVRRLLVVERGKLVGIVSATDLLRCLAAYEKLLVGRRSAPVRGGAKKKVLARARGARAGSRASGRGA